MWASQVLHYRLLLGFFLDTYRYRRFQAAGEKKIYKINKYIYILSFSVITASSLSLRGGCDVR